MRAQRARLAIVGLFLSAVAGGVGARLYQLQVVHRDFLRARATGQHLKTVEVPATRGAILDRTGAELAVSVETESLYAHPGRVSDAAGAAAALAPLLGRKASELRKSLSSERSFVYLARFLEPGTAAAVRDLDLSRFGKLAFGFLPESQRRYPRGRLAAHVVGYANIDGHGLEGIEGALDGVLSGEPTVYLIQQDGRNRRVRVPLEAPARPAQDIVLSIDRVLQHVVEREIRRAVSETGARAASVVVLDPRNGEILALSNWPAPDANNFGAGGSRARANRAIEHYYEPGSTFKIVPLAAALELGTVRPDQRIDCEQGLWTVNDRRIHDVSAHGVIPLRDVVAESSNIGMVKVGQTLRPDQFREMIEAFGFGEKTGIDLPGESAGSLRHESQWSAFSQASLSFGQEIGVTVLQMATAFGVIANDGVRVPPHVVLGLRGADGTLERLPRDDSRRVISAATARTVRSMLEGVVADGSGRRAQVEGYRLAGKSGTAQKAIRGRYHPDQYMASFGGFGPAHAPRVVCLVVLDSPRGEWTYGGQVAAPVFGRIMAETLRHLRVPYDDPPDAAPVPDTSVLSATLARNRALALPRSPGVVPDLRGLGAREAVARLVQHGYLARLDGSGTVVDQSPRPGSPLDAGGTCRIVLRRDPRSAVEARR